ncbi:MAG: pantoate--beta-alanine ligase [Proteobacteria bacterium]|nr:pantoate--beta-alanine ligase [Pseudomonadota bacterium]
MKVITSIEEMQTISKSIKRDGKTIGFVPTMGYLHEGHLSLVRASKKDCDITVVSIFVNPIQFGPKEDLSKYPRDFERDKNMLEKEGVDYIFYPKVQEMYHSDFSSTIIVEGVTKNLCGASRPGHFRGVTTVVGKLFNIVMPDKAYFGEKDFQQLVTIKKMVRDLNFPVEIVGMPIVREDDGLAMSSRNSYLSEEERKSALCLYKSILLAKDMIKSGIKDVKLIIKGIEELVNNTPNTRIDYIKICDPETLEYIEEGDIDGKKLLALAVFVGSTRLIDNVILEG